jgi:hypothetical protein
VGETRIASEYFCSKTRREKVLGKVTLNVKILLKGTGWKSEEWYHLAQDKDQWRGVASMAVNFWIA